MIAAEGTAPARDPWPVRLAIGVAPDWWRERYGDEAAAVLADLAEARGALPMRDVAGLLLRGLVLRARSSMVFWLGLSLIGFDLLGTANAYGGFVAGDRTWGSAFAHAGSGVALAVPLVAAAAAWTTASRMRGRTGIRARLAGLGRDAAAILAFAAVGYLTVLVVTLAVSGWPVVSVVDLGFPAGFAGMTVGAFGLGALLGAALPRWIAAPAGIALGLLVMFSDGWQGAELRWRNVTGSGLTFASDYGALAGSSPHVVEVVAGFALVLTLLAVGVVALGRRWMRGVAAALSLALIVAGAAALARPLLDYVGSRPVVFRSDAALHCAGDAPRICLWPEQEETVGPGLRRLLTTTYARAVALDVPVPSTLSAGVTATPDTDAALRVFSGTRPQLPAATVANLAEAIVFHDACTDHLTTAQVDQRSAADFAMAMLLGDGSDAVLAQSVTYTVVTSGGARTLTPAETRDRLGIHDAAEARAAVAMWFAERPVCSR
jgi:hypothetical protein